MSNLYEYQIVWALVAFFFIEGIIFALLGQATAFTNTGEEISLFTGLGYIFTNPFTDPWVKLFYGGLLLTPITIIGTMIVANYARGR